MAKASGMKKLVNKVYLQNKEEKTHITQGKPRWDASFFKAAAKQKEYKGVKY